MKKIEASERFYTKTDWLESYHSFSFGHHYHPEKLGHGDLVVINDDIVKANSGFGDHPHNNMDIVSWILEGELTHKDSLGSKETISYGHIQYMSAGSGVVHAEKNENETVDCRLLQMWVQPSDRDIEPMYASKKLDVEKLVGMVNIIPDQVQINNRNAKLYWIRNTQVDEVTIPKCNYGWVYISDGQAQANGMSFSKGDSLRIDEGDNVDIQISGKFDAVVWLF